MTARTPPGPAPEEFVSTRELARRLKVHRSRVPELVAAGVLPRPILLGPKSTRFPWHATVRHLEQRRDAQGAAAR